ncbi:MAG: hypothetical protein Kow0010_00280 [Dehalococcoidia bacterium]
MRRAPRCVEPHGVRDALPFGLLLGFGVMCSVVAIAMGPPEPAAAPAADLPDSSAQTGTSSNVAPTLVTDPPPFERVIATDRPGDGLPGGPEISNSDEAVGPAGPVEPPGDVAAASASPGGSSGVGVHGLPAAVSEPSVPLVDSAKAAALFAQMNDARTSGGLPPLSWDERLADVAAARAASLARDGYFDHYGPDGSSAFSELTARGIPYRLAGENLARNNYGAATTALVAFEALMASPGHRANILEPRFGRAGVAVVRDGRYWLYVTVFAD